MKGRKKRDSGLKLWVKRRWGKLAMAGGVGALALTGIFSGGKKADEPSAGGQNSLNPPGQNNVDPSVKPGQSRIGADKTVGRETLNSLRPEGAIPPSAATSTTSPQSSNNLRPGGTPAPTDTLARTPAPSPQAATGGGAGGTGGLTADEFLRNGILDMGDGTQYNMRTLGQSRLLDPGAGAGLTAAINDTKTEVTPETRFSTAMNTFGDISPEAFQQAASLRPQAGTADTASYEEASRQLQQELDRRMKEAAAAGVSADADKATLLKTLQMGQQLRPQADDSVVPGMNADNVPAQEMMQKHQRQVEGSSSASPSVSSSAWKAWDDHTSSSMKANGQYGGAVQGDPFAGMDISASGDYCDPTTGECYTSGKQPAPQSERASSRTAYASVSVPNDMEFLTPAAFNGVPGHAVDLGPFLGYRDQRGNVMRGTYIYAISSRGEILGTSNAQGAFRHWTTCPPCRQLRASPEAGRVAARYLEKVAQQRAAQQGASMAAPSGAPYRGPGF